MIEVVHQLNSVARRVGSRELPAGQARTVVLSRSYAAPIEDVWDACTNPERIPRWFLPVSGDLRLGGRFQLEGNAGGTVERCEAPNGFTATWEFGGEVSWIELRLVSLAPNQTKLELEHIAHVDDSRWADHWVGHWQDALAENPNILNPTLNNSGPFRWWIHEALLDNKPMDLFATELIRLRGSAQAGGPAGFGVASQNDVPLADKSIMLASAFMGVTMRCARCHDAPAHRSTQKELFQIAALLKMETITVPKTIRDQV